MKAILKDLIKFLFFLPKYKKEMDRKNDIDEKVRQFQLWSFQNINNPKAWDYEEFIDISEIISVRKIK